MITENEIEALWTFKWEENRNLNLTYQESREMPLPSDYGTLKYVDEFSDLEYTLFWKEWIKKINDISQFQLDLCKKVATQLQFCTSENEQLVFIADKTKDLRQKFEENKFNYLFTLYNFQEEIINEDYIDELFEGMEKSVHKILIEWYEDKNPYQTRSAGTVVIKCKEIWNQEFFDDFEDLLKILTEIKLLKLIRLKLEEKKDNELNLNPGRQFDRNQIILLMDCLKMVQAIEDKHTTVQARIISEITGFSYDNIRKSLSSLNKPQSKLTDKQKSDKQIVDGFIDKLG